MLEMRLMGDTMNEVIEAEVRDLTVTNTSPPALFGTTEPVEIVAKARDVANALKDVLRQQGLITDIQGKEYVQVGGWTLLGSMLGVFPVLEWCRKLDNGWEARVEARTLAGAVVGAAEAECTRDEKMWSNRDDYAIRSMAQTRATSKALRMPLGFVVTLAGFNATPAEEMTFEDRPLDQRPQRPQVRRPSDGPAAAQPRQSDVPVCPKCSGPVWDNRPKIASGQIKSNAPKFKCKDKKCDTPIWDVPVFDDDPGPAPDYDALPNE